MVMRGLSRLIMRGVFIVGGLALAMASARSQCTFYKEYAINDARTYFYDVEEVSDGGYIITGELHNLQTDGHDLLLLRTDDDGYVDWYRTFSAETGSEVRSEGHAVMEVPDGGFIVVGAGGTDFAEQKAWIIKTDSKGVLEWDQLHGRADGVLFDLISTPEGRYMACGRTDHFYSLLIEFDLYGVIHAEICTGEQELHALETTEDGGFIASGSWQKSDATDWFPYVVKLSKEHQVEWERAFDESVFGGGGDVFDIMQTSDGEYAFTGLVVCRCCRRETRPIRRNGMEACNSL